MHTNFIRGNGSARENNAQDGTFKPANDVPPIFCLRNCKQFGQRITKGKIPVILGLSH